MTTIKTLKRKLSQPPSSVPVSPCSSLIISSNSSSTADNDESDDGVVFIKKSRQECSTVVDDNDVNVQTDTTGSSFVADHEVPKKVRFASAEPELVPNLSPGEDDGSSNDYLGWYTQQDYVTFFRDRQQTIQLYKKAKQVGRMRDFISNHDRFCLRGLESYYQPMNSSTMKRQHRAVHRQHVFMQQYHSLHQPQEQQQQQPRLVEFVHGNNYNFAKQVVSRMSFYSSRRARILAKWDEQDAMLIHYCSTTQSSSSSLFSSTDNLESYNRDPTQQQSVVSLDNDDDDDILVHYTSSPTSIFEDIPNVAVPIFPSYIKTFPQQPQRHHHTSRHRLTSFVPNNNTPVYNNNINNNTMFNREDFINTANSPLYGDCI